ncbi:MAG: hypothetical protein L3J08_09215 [Flavobacteriaceae bacterium]|nr:hypothetical protein [Flavobacteriaceae bacterium]
MISPNKYENIKTNSLVLGAKIVAFLQNEKSASIVDIQIFLRKHKIEISYQKLFDTLTFLFIADIIDYNNNLIYIKNDTRKSLHNSKTFI